MPRLPRYWNQEVLLPAQNKWDHKRDHKLRREVAGCLQVIDLSGGASRDRTDDLFHAMEALSQLSYGPARKSLISKGI
jgi:hypothetical protein